MKTLLIASALTLIANTALANDIYGAFVNPDVDSTHGNNYGVTFPVIQPRDFEPSIVAFHKGDPEYPQAFEGDVGPRSQTIGALTAYDHFVRGNPDTGPVDRADPRRYRSSAQAFALEALIDGDRI